MKNKSMKKILDYFRVKEYFKIIHDEIKNNFKNVIFLMTGVVFRNFLKVPKTLRNHIAQS